MLQRELLEFCRQQAIQVVAYSPLGCGHLLLDTDIVDACSRAGVDVPLALLRWGVQRGLCVIPKSSHQKRIEWMQPTCVLAESLPQPLQDELDACDTATGKFCWDPTDLL